METNLETLPIGEDAPRLVNAVIEVPVGSRNKYEYEPDLGVIVRDRVLPGAVRYPTDYGFVPSTLTDRGDALDIVVAAYDPAFPGCVVRAHRRHPARVAVEVRLDSSLSREVLDVLQVSATTEHDREAAMPPLIPL